MADNGKHHTKAVGFSRTVTFCCITTAPTTPLSLPHTDQREKERKLIESTHASLPLVEAPRRDHPPAIVAKTPDEGEKPKDESKPPRTYQSGLVYVKPPSPFSLS